MFLGGGVGLVFFGGFLPMFLLCFWRFAPESVWKNSLDVRYGVFLGSFSLPFGFFVDVVFRGFVLKRYRSGRNRTPPHAPVLFVLVLFCFVPPRFLFRPFWPCVLLLGVFLGVPFWAPRVFGILLELMGLEVARPFQGPFSWDVRRQGCFLASCPWFLFCPFCFVLRLHTFS